MATIEDPASRSMHLGGLINVLSGRTEHVGRPEPDFWTDWVEALEASGLGHAVVETAMVRTGGDGVEFDTDPSDADKAFIDQINDAADTLHDVASQLAADGAPGQTHEALTLTFLLNALINHATRCFGEPEHTQIALKGCIAALETAASVANAGGRIPGETLN